MTYAQLLGQIQKGQFAPVYYLFGEEGYYLDQLEAALETHVLAGAEEHHVAAVRVLGHFRRRGDRLPQRQWPWRGARGACPEVRVDGRKD